MNRHGWERYLMIRGKHWFLKTIQAILLNLRDFCCRKKLPAGALKRRPCRCLWQSQWPRMVYLERKGHQVRRSVDSSSRWKHIELAEHAVDVCFGFFGEALGVYIEWEFRLHRSYNMKLWHLFPKSLVLVTKFWQPKLDDFTCWNQVQHLCSQEEWVSSSGKLKISWLARLVVEPYVQHLITLHHNFWWGFQYNFSPWGQKFNESYISLASMCLEKRCGRLWSRF